MRMMTTRPRRVAVAGSPFAPDRPGTTGAGAHFPNHAMKGIEQFRKEIDRTDRDIVRLLNRRTRLASAIGRLKKADGDPVFVPERERQVYKRVQTKNGGPLPEASLRHIYREIMSAALAIEGRMVVACAGHEAESAARSRLGDSIEYVRTTSPTRALAAVRSGRADLAVVARTTKADAICEIVRGRTTFKIVRA